MKNEYYLQRCLTLSKQAATKENSAVGTVIVKDDKIISEAEEAVYTKKDITCHAELEALRIAVNKLGMNLSGCILYSTHEPCIMCSYAIRFYKIKEVVYLNASEYLGGISSSMPLLTTTEVPPNWSNAPVIVHLKNDNEL